MSEIVRDYEVCNGLYRIAGTRITVRAIKSLHRAGHSISEIRAEYPTLSAKQIKSAIDFRVTKPRDGHPMNPTPENQQEECSTCAGEGWVAISVAVCCGNPTRTGECCCNPVEGQQQDACPDCGGHWHLPPPPCET